jgi:hypothetical protein
LSFFLCVFVGDIPVGDNDAKNAALSG